MNRIYVAALALSISMLSPFCASAMPIGSLVYRTSGNGMIYGLNTDNLLESKHGIISDFYSGHVGIYVGQENGIDYVVEALSGGVVKNEARYFVNEGQGEKYLGAKIPKEATLLDRLKAVEIAKRIAELNLGYDFDFSSQKGPKKGDWTCVGLAEKVYESSGISNPYNLSALEYDPDFYNIDITPDGFEDYNVVNGYGDTFAADKEFSKISRRKDMLVPAMESLGYDAGYEHNGNRYFFLPYTQFIQPTLEDTDTDIDISSNFHDDSVRAPISTLAIILKWSFVNNPVSTVKQLARYVADTVKGGTKESSIALEDGNNPYPTSKSSSTGSLAAYSDLPSFSLDDLELSSNKDIKEASEEDGYETKEDQVDQSENTATVSYENDAKETEAAPEAYDLPEFEVSKSENIKSQAEKVSVIYESTYASATSPYQVSLSGRKIDSPGQTSDAASNEASDNQNNESESEAEAAPLPLLIRRIYATASDDWLEIYNPNDTAIDLSSSGYRLEKAKTATDPSIMLRFDNAEDAEFMFGSIIPPKQSMVVADKDASAGILSQAHVIAKNSNFSWRSDGYVIYLASGPVSSPDDEDILDMVGFGNASYYEGSPAPEILDNHILWRKPRQDTKLEDLLSDGEDRNMSSAIDTGNNANDFLLVPLVDPVTDSEEESGAEEPDGGDGQDNDQAEDTGGDTSSGSAISVSGLSHLWHFDECYGGIAGDYIGDNALSTPGYWDIGRFGCGLETYYKHDPLPNLLSPGEKVDSNNFSLSFWMESLSDSSRTELLFDRDSNGNFLRLIFNPSYIHIEGLPNIETIQNPFNIWEDGTWHLAAVSVNEDRGDWRVYLDGEKYFSGNLNEGELLPLDYSRLRMINDNGFTTVDELALYDRGLSDDEIKDIYDFNLPMTPLSPSWNPLDIALLNFWDFNEAQGVEALDSVGGEIMNIADQAEWILNSRSNSNLRQTSYDSRLHLDFSDSFQAGDLSLSFWWRNSAYPDEGRGEIALIDDNSDYVLAFVPSKYNASYFIGGSFYSLDEGVFPDDSDWHNVILAYDRLSLAFSVYIDGEEAVSHRYIAWQPEKNISTLQIANQNFHYDIDDISIWQGSLSRTDAFKIYSDGRVDRLEE